MNIENCTINVIGVNASAGIGGSRVVKAATAEDAITVNIKKSTINATGGQYGAGIGSGYDTYCHSVATAPMNKVTIDAESKITAQGGKLAAGIGTGHNVVNFVGDIQCDVSNVKAGDSNDKCCLGAVCTEAQNVGLGSLKQEAFKSDFTFVSTADELKALSATTLTGNNSKAEEATIVITSDIDMQGADFSAIIAQRGDSLTVIGNGYTISNVNVVSGTNDNTTGQASMFYAYPNSTLTISDLVLKNIVATSDSNSSGYAAAVIGYCEGTAVLNNVDVVNATVTGAKSSGILVGHLSGALNATNCNVSGTVTLTDYETGGHYAGKYIGTLATTATLSQCTADVTISGNLKSDNVGDIFGRNLGTLNQ